MSKNSDFSQTGSRITSWRVAVDVNDTLLAQAKDDVRGGADRDANEAVVGDFRLNPFLLGHALCVTKPASLGVGVAKKIIDSEGAADRIQVLAADVLSGPLFGSYDVVILRALLQVLSSEDARLAVKNVAAAINPGGRIYIIGQILDDSRISPPEAVGFNLSLISQFDSGESYTEREHRSWLSEAGFVGIERADFLLPDEHGLMMARKPQ